METTNAAIGATAAEVVPDKDIVVAQWKDGFAKLANMTFALSVFRR